MVIRVVDFVIDFDELFVGVCSEKNRSNVFRSYSRSIMNGFNPRTCANLLHKEHEFGFLTNGQRVKITVGTDQINEVRKTRQSLLFSYEEGW